MDSNTKKDLQTDIKQAATVADLVNILNKYFDPTATISAHKRWQMGAFGFTFMDGLPEKKNNNHLKQTA